MALRQVAMRVSPEEKALLEAAAAAEGVSVSVFMYRRLFNQPDANRSAGRPKTDATADHHTELAPEGLFDIAV